MKIALVNVNFRTSGAEQLLGYMTPLPLLLIGGALIKSGYKNIQLFDAANKNYDNDRVAKLIDEGDFNVIFISNMASTASLPLVLDLAFKIKERCRFSKIVIGGVHSTYHYEEIMNDCDYVDFICRGEGESFCVHLVDAISNNSSLSDVPGLVWRDGDGLIIKNNDSDPINLNEYSAGWDLIEDWDCYVSPMTRERAAVVQFSRGCPFSCSFCGQWDFWKVWRHKNLNLFVDEIEYLKNKYNVTCFVLADENPQSNSEIWYSLLEEIKERALGVHLILNLRVSDIIRDKDYLPLYKSAGISMVDLGVESASQKRLDFLNKKTTIDQNKEAISLLRANDIVSIVQTIIGFSDESIEGLEASFRLLESWKPDILHFYHATPFRWTDYGKKIDNNLIIQNDYRYWDYKHQILKLNNISNETLSLFLAKFLFEYHFSSSSFYRLAEMNDRYNQGALINAYFLNYKYNYIEKFKKLTPSQRQKLKT